MFKLHKKLLDKKLLFEHCNESEKNILNSSKQLFLSSKRFHLNYLQIVFNLQSNNKFQIVFLTLDNP